jgi:acyl carrier protein
MTNPSIDTALRSILEAALGKRAVPAHLDDATPLLGAIPELDSMAVLGVLTQIQEDFGVSIDDDEVSAEMFETYGALRGFVASKLG